MYNAEPQRPQHGGTQHMPQTSAAHGAPCQAEYQPSQPMGQQPIGQNGFPVGHPPYQPPLARSGMAVAGLVLGIIALLTSFLPIINNVAFLLALLGLVFSIVGLVGVIRGKKVGKGMTIAATVLNVLSIVIVLATQAMFGAALGEASKSIDESAVSAGNAYVSTDDSSADKEESADSPSGTSSDVNAVEDGAGVPAEYESALKKAQSYSDMMHMSKAGLYDQLTSEYGEQFSAEAAQYAVDNVNADWNANALEKARSYQETMSMSPEAIRDQLTSEYGEQFTQEEADYAVANL